MRYRKIELSAVEAMGRSLALEALAQTSDFGEARSRLLAEISSSLQSLTGEVAQLSLHKNRARHIHVHFWCYLETPPNDGDSVLVEEEG